MLRSLGGTSFTTRSPIRIVPSLVSSNPAIMRSVVVLPHPDGPTKTTNSLSGISRLIWFTAVTLSKRLLSSWSVTLAIKPSPLVLTRSLDRPLSEARDVIIHKHHIDEHDWDRAQDGARHQGAPVKNVPPNQLRRHAHGGGLLGRRGDEPQGIDNLVPGARKGEENRAHDARDGHRQHNPDERLEARTAIHHGALLDFLRNGTEVSKQQPGTEGHQEGGVGHDQGPHTISQAKPI